MDDDILWVIALIPLALLGWWLAIRIIAIFAFTSKIIFNGAILLFGWASEQGFLGFIAYFAAWVFLFPVMLISSIIYGITAHSEGGIDESEDTQNIKSKQNGTYNDATSYEQERGY